MELREVNVEDVYPDEKNPRRDFGDIKALAESCMLNAINPGEPVNPIVVVEDGGIYRIVDGERRYKAMTRNKLTRCHVVVCEDMDEANAMVAMVATDDKQQLTDIERSRGVQQMLLLGVEPEKVERVGRMAKGSAAKVNKAMIKVDDAAEDMTLDRLYAIAEFADDTEAVERLTTCPEALWQEVARDERMRRQDNEKRSAFLRACEDAGIELSEERKFGKDGWSWCKDVRNPDDIATTVAKIPKDSVAYLFKGSNGLMIEFCKPITDEEEQIDPEQVERNRHIAEVEGMIESSRKNHALWFCAHLDNLDSMPNVMEIIEDSAFSGSNGIGKEINDFENATGSKVDGAFCPRLAVYGYVATDNKIGLDPCFGANLVNGDIFYHASKIERHLEWLTALEADGYQPTEADIEIRCLCESWIENDENEGE